MRDGLLAEESQSPGDLGWNRIQITVWVSVGAM